MMRRSGGPVTARARVAAGAPAALPLSTVPDKRQQSKQRRAARNRANRDALAARRENIVAAVNPTGSTSSSSSSSNSGHGTAGGGRSAPAATEPPRGLMGMLQSKRVGDKAVLATFALAVGGAIGVLFYRVPADDRGEPLPVTFRGVAIAARERITGEPLPDKTVSLLDASGPQLLLLLALPIAVAAFALWANRRPDRARLLTFAMLAMAGATILTGGVGLFFFPAMIALAIGGFRVRRADLPARTAERATRGGRGRGRGGVIDVDSEEVVDHGDAAGPMDMSDLSGAGDALDRDAEPASDDADVSRDAGDETDSAGGAGVDAADPLAALEAEIEAERAADDEAGDDRAGGDDQAGGDDPGDGRPGRTG